MPRGPIQSCAGLVLPAYSWERVPYGGASPLGCVGGTPPTRRRPAVKPPSKAWRSRSSGEPLVAVLLETYRGVRRTSCALLQRRSLRLTAVAVNICGQHQRAANKEPCHDEDVFVG